MLAIVLDDLRARGRRRARELERLLADRGPDWVPPASRLEGRFHHLVDAAGDPPFQRRVIIADASGVVGEVDCWDPNARLVVEIDSVRFHAAPLDQAHDAARDARLRALGIHVERVGELDLFQRPNQVLERVRRLRRERTARPA